MKKRMGNCTIIPIVVLKHQRNTSVTIDVPPGVDIIDIVVVSAWGRRTDAAESNSVSMDMCHGSTGMTGSLKGTVRRRGRESIH